MVRILFASWYSGLGGGETDLLTLAGALDKSRYQPHLLLPAAGPLAERWRGKGWPVHIIPYRGASTWFIPAIWARFPVVRRLCDLFNEAQIDIVQSDYHTLPLIAPAAERAGIGLTWTVHGWWFKPKPWQRAFFRRIPVVARSRAIRDGFLGAPPFMPPENLPVIYTGVDTRRFHPGLDRVALRREIGIGDDAEVVAMVARFQPVKGHHNFQAMAEAILAQRPDVRFIVAGGNDLGSAADQRYRADILARAQSNPTLRDRLHYLGFRGDVERVYAAADVFVCPSDFESYGIANLEAMACATPVVSIGRGGPSETIVDGVTGYLVEPGAPEELAGHVLRLLDDRALRKRMGAAGRARIESDFSIEAAAAAYSKIYEDLLALN